eukprot:scaffold33796_cov63-Phaeocystis_antarctica.AAC.2
MSHTSDATPPPPPLASASTLPLPSSVCSPVSSSGPPAAVSVDPLQPARASRRRRRRSSTPREGDFSDDFIGPSAHLEAVRAPADLRASLVDPTSFQ